MCLGKAWMHLLFVWFERLLEPQSLGYGCADFNSYRNGRNRQGTEMSTKNVFWTIVFIFPLSLLWIVAVVVGLAICGLVFPCVPFSLCALTSFCNLWFWRYYDCQLYNEFFSAVLSKSLRKHQMV